jgi:hypothetical protein
MMMVIEQKKIVEKRGQQLHPPFFYLATSIRQINSYMLEKSQWEQEEEVIGDHARTLMPRSESHESCPSSTQNGAIDTSAFSTCRAIGAADKVSQTGRSPEGDEERRGEMPPRS